MVQVVNTYQSPPSDFDLPNSGVDKVPSPPSNDGSAYILPIVRTACTELQ